MTRPNAQPDFKIFRNLMLTDFFKEQVINQS